MLALMLALMLAGGHERERVEMKPKLRRVNLARPPNCTDDKIPH